MSPVVANLTLVAITEIFGKERTTAKEVNNRLHKVHKGVDEIFYSVSSVHQTRFSKSHEATRKNQAQAYR